MFISAATRLSLKRISAGREADVLQVLTEKLSQEQYVLTQCGTTPPSTAEIEDLAPNTSAYQRKHFSIPLQNLAENWDWCYNLGFSRVFTCVVRFAKPLQGELPRHPRRVWHSFAVSRSRIEWPTRIPSPPGPAGKRQGAGPTKQMSATSVPVIFHVECLKKVGLTSE